MASVRRLLDSGAWLVLVLALIGATWFGWQWQRTRALNAMIGDGRVEKLDPVPNEARLEYAVAWFRARARNTAGALHLYTLAQIASEPELAANAAFALGNAYFQIGVDASRDYEASVGPVFENAQFDLARDAYRNALRIEPNLAGARYNLELLERLAPARHGEGWRQKTDPVMLQPERHNGWTMMQNDRKRGLP